MSSLDPAHVKELTYFATGLERDLYSSAISKGIGEASSNQTPSKNMAESTKKKTSTCIRIASEPPAAKAPMKRKGGR
jgi:hypothetical protein